MADNNVPYDEEIDFNSILDSLELSVYWKDTNGIYRGCNKYAANMVKLSSPQDIIGKTDYDLFDEETSKNFRNHDLMVIEEKKVISVEEHVMSPDGKLLTQLSIKKPLYNKSGDVIGVVANTVNITAERDAEKLRVENASYQAELRAQEELIKFIDSIENTLQRFKMNILNKSLGVNQFNIKQYKNIKLTTREEQVIYLLAMGKRPKEIAIILGKLENKVISHKTISSIINKKLYIKFDVSSYGQLIDKAISLNLIAFMPPSLAKLLNKKLCEL